MLFNLTGHGLPRLNIISGCVCEGFQVRIAFDSVDSVDCPPIG